MNLSNKINRNDHAKTLGDAKTTSSRDIKFFWSANKPQKENILACLASCALCLFILFFILAFILTLNNVSQNIIGALAIADFLSIFAFFVLKLNERKARKRRESDFVNSKLREIV